MTPSHIPVVTIDGPSGSGKGALTALLAKWTGFHVLDSGALYRLVGVAARKPSVSLGNEQARGSIAENLDVSFVPDDAGDDWQVLLSGERVTERIRTDEAGVDASMVSQFPVVRAAMIGRQRAFQQLPGLLADGRDMGTVVFPDAFLKIFLDASASIRAQRRYNQLKEKGFSVTLRRLEKEIADRDAQDRNRSVSPLIPAVDAVVLDTSEKGIVEVFTEVVTLMEDRLPTR